jgi:hypothetical protein
MAIYWLLLTTRRRENLTFNLAMAAAFLATALALYQRRSYAEEMVRLGRTAEVAAPPGAAPSRAPNLWLIVALIVVVTITMSSFVGPEWINGLPFILLAVIFVSVVCERITMRRIVEGGAGEQRP